MTDVDVWVPTHRVSAGGVACWAAPDPATPALGVRLDPDLEVRSVERRGDWMHVECSNGWSTWVDARLMEPLVAAPPPSPPQPAASQPDGAFHPTHAAPAAGPAALPLLTVEGFASVSAWDTPAAFLVSDTPDQSSFKLGLVLVIAAVLALLPLLTRRPLPPVALLAIAAPATNTGVHIIFLKLRAGNLYPSLGPGTLMVTVGGFVVTASALWWVWRERQRAFQG